MKPIILIAASMLFVSVASAQSCQDGDCLESNSTDRTGLAKIIEMTSKERTYTIKTRSIRIEPGNGGLPTILNENDSETTVTLIAPLANPNQPGNNSLRFYLTTDLETATGACAVMGMQYKHHSRAGAEWMSGEAIRMDHEGNLRSIIRASTPIIDTLTCIKKE